jgi:hypothetical protein
MPKIRIGLSTDFNLAGEQVGIGTTNPTARVDVAGQILAKNTGGSGGVSTYREYQGFHQTQSNVSNTVLIDATDAGNLNSLSGEIRIDGDVTIAPDTSVTSGKIDSLTATDKFAVPLGETNSRENAPEAGTIRFNQDFGTLEFFDGNNWKTVNKTSRSGRAVFGGGTVPSTTNTMEYVQISTFGNSLDFGDLVGTTESPGGCSSSIKGLFSGGRNPGQLDRMDYITIASAGNAIDFGNLTDSGRLVYNALSSSTRGVNLGGYKTSTSGNTNVIDYVELPTLGDALDFGDVTTSRRAGSAFSSPTRGIYGGGFSSVSESVIESLTIASKGNTIRFGELTFRGYGQGQGTCSSPVRGLFAGGNQDGSASGYRTEISYVTIASEGNATYFGDLAVARATHGKASNSIRGVFAGGYTPTLLSSIETILISEGGSALDFGDLSAIRRGFPGVSDSHGGLGGF